jgi:hypothetical protein
MDDAVCMQVFERIGDLLNVELHLDLGQSFATHYNLIQGLSSSTSNLPGSCRSPTKCIRFRGLRKHVRNSPHQGGAEICGSLSQILAK